MIILEVDEGEESHDTIAGMSFTQREDEADTSGGEGRDNVDCRPPRRNDCSCYEPKKP